MRLEAEADEAFILASQLPELEEAASRVMVLRRRKEELECQKAEADSLEGELALMALSIERTGVMKKQLEEMEAQKAELDSIERALGEQAVVELRLARAKMDLTNVHHNVHSIQRIQHEILEIRDRITGNSLVVSHQEDAAAGSEILDVGVALTEIDKDAEEEAMQQVKERLERERGRRNALLAQQKELERLSRESEALVVDNEVLKAQCASAIAMFSSSDKDSASTSDPSRPSEDEAVAKAEEAGPIAAVFSRVRKLEGDKAALKAQVSELTSEVEKLRQGLSASVKRLEEYRNLAATVSSMRKNRTGMGQ